MFRLNFSRAKRVHRNGAHSMSSVNGEVKLSDHSNNKALTIPSLSPSKSVCPNVAGGFYRALGALISGRKTKLALRSLSIINCDSGSQGHQFML